MYKYLFPYLRLSNLHFFFSAALLSAGLCDSFFTLLRIIIASEPSSYLMVRGTCSTSGAPHNLNLKVMCWWSSAAYHRFITFHERGEDYLLQDMNIEIKIPAAGAAYQSRIWCLDLPQKGCLSQLLGAVLYLMRYWWEVYYGYSNRSAVLWCVCEVKIYNTSTALQYSHSKSSPYELANAVSYQCFIKLFSIFFSLIDVCVIPLYLCIHCSYCPTNTGVSINV